MSQKSLWAKFPRAIYAFLLGLLDGKAAFTEYTLQIWLSKWAPQYQTNSIGHQGTFGKHHKSTMLHSGPKKCKSKQISSRYAYAFEKLSNIKQFDQKCLFKKIIYVFCLGFCALFEFEFRAVWEKRKEEREENGLLYIFLYYCSVILLPRKIWSKLQQNKNFR